MAEKVYLKASAKEKRFGTQGSKIVIGVKAADLIAFANQHANEKGYVNLVVTARKEVGQYGDTHSVYLDDWTPTKRGGDDLPPF